MPPIHSVPSKNRGSIGLIRGNPSARRVASMHRFPGGGVAADEDLGDPRSSRGELLPGGPAVNGSDDGRRVHYSFHLR